MEVHQEKTALILLSAAQEIIKNRRQLELMCGYPPEYGGDRELLQSIDKFLSDSDIQHEVNQAIKKIKKFMKKP